MRKLVALWSLLAVVAVGQEVPRHGETVEVSIVNVDVVVTDRAGNRIHGLTRADFELRENGKVQPISNFAEYVSDVEQGTVGVDVAEPAPQQPAAPAAARREKRTLLIFFEHMQLVHAAADEFAQSLRETVKQLVGPGDAVSFVIWSHYESEHVEFTTDPAKIDKAIERIVREAKRARVDQLALQRVDIAGRRALQKMGGEDPAAQILDVDPGSDLAPYMLAAYNEMTVRVAAINSAIDSLAGVEGKKILLLATHRLGDVAGAEFAFNSGMPQLTPFLKERYNTHRMRKSIIDNANASGVTIYPVNPPGLVTPSGDTEYQDIDDLGSRDLRPSLEHLILMNETISLEKIAKETGGLMAAGWKNVVELLPRVVSDATDYYSLAYRVTFTGTDRARSIAVKTRNPEYTVRSRAQFVEKSDDTRMRDRLQSTLFNAGQHGASIDIRAAAREKKKNRRTSTMQVRVRIPIADLTLLPQANGKLGGSFSVYVGVASDVDELSDVTRKTQTFEVGEAQMEQAQTGHFTYDLDVEVRHKSKHLAVGVFDETGKSFGFARVELDFEPGK